MTCLEVAVTAPLDHTLIYSYPEDIHPCLLPGQRLLVPLGNRLVTGYLLDFVSSTFSGPGNRQLKPIAEVLDDEPLFTKELIPFFRWVARYYHYPIGEVIKSALPGGLTVMSGRRVILSERGRQYLTAQRQTENGPSYRWLTTLLNKGCLSPASCRQIWRAPDRHLLEKWEKNGWLEIKTELTGGTTRTMSEACVALADMFHSRTSYAECLIKLRPSEMKTLDLLADLSKAQGPDKFPFIPCRDLIKIYAGARKALKNLAEKKLVVLEERQVYRDPFGESHHDPGQPEKLTTEQEGALHRLLPAIREKEFAPFLLHGITGSGKTEVYLQAAAAALRDSRDVLILVPEIALASQLEVHFLARFGSRVALLHSGLTKGEFYDQWRKIVRGDAMVVLGARSAIFAPLRNLGLIVVDEEHESSYKQEDGLRYQARDLAVLRASLTKAAVVLGSATPSVNSYHHAQTGKYRLIVLKNRIEQRALPEVSIVDLRRVKTVSGKPPLFSPPLISALKENLEHKLQSLVFLNRRGYANLVVCQDCGRNVQCRNCQITLTMHKNRGELICHYCGYSITSAMVCSSCRSPRLIRVGFGTERLEEELTRLFPSAHIARLDRDTCVKRKDYLAVLKAMHNSEVDILVGTQMIAKGHHFPKVTLVGVVWADAGLGIPDFRAGERAFQLISQVTGRAGRGQEAGRVIIQTYQPDHYSIALARKHDYTGLYDKEMSLRRELAYPPFSRLINLRIEGRDEKMVRKAALDCAVIAKELNRFKPPVTILGPTPAPLTRLRSKYRWQLLLKGNDVRNLHFLGASLLHKGPAFSRDGKVRISIDVDPENLL